MFFDSATVALGAEAPDFTLRDPAGQTHRLEDYRGHPVLLVFLRGFL